MSAFIDTGFLIAFHNVMDVNHTRAVELMKKIVDGEFGTVYTSDYIFDEAVTLTLIRTRRPEIALTMGKMILGELTTPFLILLRVDNEVFEEAWRLFSRYAERGLSFTDCTSIALIKRRGIESIISFDKDFDGIIPRIS